jgi:hypothetical protein
MPDNKKKSEGVGKSPDSSWVDHLGGQGATAPTGVTPYVGLLRESPDDESMYQLYLGLDMRSCLYIQKADVAHWEDLPKEKSPFGSLGGSRVYVKDGAKIKSVRTTATTFESGAVDEFDLDIRLGSRSGFAAAGNQTIPETGCGAACETIPPFTDPDVCQVATGFATCDRACTINDTCVCPPTRGGKTCGVNCQITRAFTCTCHTLQTCNTNCGTCQTCATCATQCGTCATHCGTCRVNTCNTKCGQETCVACTHIFTQCNQHGCNPF